MTAMSSSRRPFPPEPASPGDRVVVCSFYAKCVTFCGHAFSVCGKSPLAPYDGAGFRHPPLAPSDEGAGSAADWGRESPGFSGKIGNIETFSLPPALRATSLVRGRLGFLLSATPVEAHPREAGVSASIYAGEPLIRGRLEGFVSCYCSGCPSCFSGFCRACMA